MAVKGVGEGFRGRKGGDSPITKAALKYISRSTAAACGLYSSQHPSPHSLVSKGNAEQHSREGAEA